MATVDPAGTVRDIVDAALYLVLGTADETGRPWATPAAASPSSTRVTRTAELPAPAAGRGSRPPASG